MSSKPTPRILIVEDERLISLDLSRRLPKLGSEVCAIVPTGEEAVAKAAELEPDLVLMDICLKGEMDGIQAAEIIKRDNDRPVVFLSANSDEATLNRAKLSRPSSYLLKPFKERELQIGIDMALLNHALNRELKEARENLELRVVERTEELAQVNGALRIEVDIRKRMEEQAREQADLLSKARDAIYVRDLAGTISFWNQGAERLFGVAGPAALGRKVRDVMGEENAAAMSAAETATLEKGDWNGELRHVTPKGTELTVESRWTLVRTDSGAPKTILVVNTDVTERKRIAEQFMRTQRLESIGALASGIAHDLNNVFAPILMATELMEGSNGPDNAHILDMVKTTARRGADMVKQVLMFVRGGEHELEPTSLGHLATEVRRLMEQTLPCTIQVSSHVAREPRPVLGDATQLHQLMVNLCVNARDAMPDGGHLRIDLDETEVDAAKARRAKGARPGTYARLAITDTGTGIPPEVRAKIFEPFFTTKGIGKGTGLGLSTVFAIVESHGGFMELESEVGRGSTFIIYLPVCETTHTEMEKDVGALPRGRGELVIVVDDEHSMREIAKLTLEDQNYRVLLASDGAEAISVYLQNRDEVALVITDIMMPMMNGRAMIHALHKFNPDLPIVAFSAAEPSDPLVGSLDEEKVKLLRKPATPHQLLTAAAEALAAARFAQVWGGSGAPAQFSI